MGALTFNQTEVDHKQRSGLAVCCAAITSLLGGALLTSTSLRLFGTTLTSGGVIVVSALLLYWVFSRPDIHQDKTQPKKTTTRALDRAWVHCFWSVSALVMLLIADRV